MITIDSLRNAYIRSFQGGGSTRKARRAGVNWEKATGDTTHSTFNDFVDFLGTNRLLNDFGKQTGSNIVGMYENFLRSRGELGDNEHYRMEGNPYFAKDMTDVFRKVSKNVNGDFQKWWDENRKARYEYDRTHSVPGGAAASRRINTQPNAEERDIPDVEPGNGAGEVPTPQNPNPGAWNTPIPELPELNTEIEIEEEPYEIPEDEQADLSKKLEDDTSLGVDYIDNSYDKMYHHASKNDLRQFRRGNDYTYGDGMFNTVKASDSNRANRQLVRGIRQGRREDARNYLNTGEYNYNFKEMPEYNGKPTNVARGIRNGQYTSQRNGGAMMSTFIGAMRRGGRL